jgi:hypothetical protein
MIHLQEIRTERPVVHQPLPDSCFHEQWPSYEVIALRDDPFAICWSRSLACMAVATGTIALLGWMYYSMK